jgi:hypothetical protein
MSSPMSSPTPPLRSMRMVDQPLIESIAEHVRRYGLKSVPPAALALLYGREQMGGVAAQDQYDAQ